MAWGAFAEHEPCRELILDSLLAKDGPRAIRHRMMGLEVREGCAFGFPSCSCKTIFLLNYGWLVVNDLDDLLLWCLRCPNPIWLGISYQTWYGQARCSHRGSVLSRIRIDSSARPSVLFVAME
jgi:hypothetical protein